MKKRSWLKWIGGFAVIIAVFSLTRWGASPAQASDRYDELQLFAKVLNLVQQYYVEKVDTKKLIYGGIKGMLSELDPHTNFLPPEIFKEFESETSGQFGGLGIEITVQNGILTVISPIEDTPAYKAGIKAGDKIVSINGHSTKGLSLVEAAQLMKGKNGSKVILGIYREGFDQPKDYAVVRGVVKIKSVKYTDLGDGYAYIRLTSFIDNSAKDMRRAILRHMKKYNGMKGMILDLRHNPGGLLDQAVGIANLFIDKGVIVSTMDRDKKEKDVMYAKPEDTLPKFPLIVLIDGYSASASEILAGALQDHHRALIMGQRSFGKGSVQSVVKLGDGSGLKLTVARYYTPSGRSIQAEGIMPDVILPNLSSKVLQKAMIKVKWHREGDMQNHLANENEGKEGVYDDDETLPANPKEKIESNAVLMHLFWDDAAKDKSDNSPAAKMLRDDFELLQAYNYLRSWTVIHNFDAVKLDDKTEAKLMASNDSEDSGVAKSNAAKHAAKKKHHHAKKKK